MTQTELETFRAAIGRADDAALEKLALALDETAEPGLVEMLASHSVDMRWWSTRALAHCGTAAGVPAVAARLGDEDAGVRAVAALALAHLQEHHSEPVASYLSTLAARLADDDGLVRQTASDALAQCGNAAVPVLARILAESRHAGARARAAAALRKIGTMQAAAVLYPVLNDPNYLVRTYAYEGLDEMGLLTNILFKP